MTRHSIVSDTYNISHLKQLADEMGHSHAKSGHIKKNLHLKSQHTNKHFPSLQPLYTLPSHDPH
jgi:hypothetical protein